MPKIFLTNPPLNMAETPLQYHRPLVPLGLAYIGAMLEEKYSCGDWSRYVAQRLAHKTPKGYRPSGAVAALDNMFLSFYGRYSYDLLKERIAYHAAGSNDELFIGMSVLSDGMHAARRILRRLRTDFPFATIVVGGPHATFFPYDFYVCPEQRQGPLADYVIRNEGELVILGIVDGMLGTIEQLKSNGPSFGIDLAKCNFQDDYRVIDGGQYRGSSGNLGEHELDSLPPPAYFLFEDKSGQIPYEPDTRYGLQVPAANINSSRGCPHKCTFCTIPTLAPGYRTLSPKRMVDLMTFLSIEYHVRSIFFREDNFMYEGGTVEGTRWKDVEEFCRELKSALPDVRWAIEARADNLVQPTSTGGSRLELLSASGLTGIYVGVESGSDAMLKLYVKGSTVHTMSEAVRACAGHGIAVVATACYGDPDIFLRRNYPLINFADRDYEYGVIGQRERILHDTRSFLDQHEIPLERREEYALVGIPVSALYRVLEREHTNYPDLVENIDPITRYIYPKGFRWWANAVYELKRRVRPYISYEYQPVDV